MGQSVSFIRASYKLRLQQVLASALIASLVGCCCPAMSAARDAARRAQSMNNMRLIILEAHSYQEANGDWPESLDDLSLSSEITKNPVTNDSPGYEYVKPGDDAETVGLSQTPILYQLRNGERDESMAIGYADGAVSGGS